MVDHVVVAPMLVALATAIGTLLVRRFPRVTTAVSVAGVAGYAVAVAALVSRVLPDAVLTYQLSGWTAPFGITLVADALSAFMLALSALVAVPALAYSVRYVDAFGQRISFHTLYHLMLVGVTGAFLTGDVFNLFVWFEVMLMASYVLVVFYGGAEHTRAALRYAVLNLVGSAFMLVAVGGIYATTGTLNMADIARRLGEPARYGVDPAPVLGLSAILFAVFALKAGLVPFQFWVPAAYRAAPAPVSAVLAGVVKKVGVYAIVRLYFTVFAAGSLGVPLAGPFEAPNDPGGFLGFFGPVLFVLAVASIVVGGVTAVGKDDLDELLAYSSIGQVGFIVLPLAVGAAVPAVRHLAIAATLVSALNHAAAKGLLFLASGAIRDGTGTVDLRHLGGLIEGSPGVTAGFFVGALALVGIPPLSGFFGKLLVFDVAARAGADAALAAALLGAVLTIAYVTRAWNRGFWGAQSNAVEHARTEPVLVAIVAVLAVAVVAIGVGFDPVYRTAEAAADAALARGDYVEAVDLAEVKR
ncbi:MAG: proton-conducting transporter membrane subunit [Halobacteriales archaeon]